MTRGAPGRRRRLAAVAVGVAVVVGGLLGWATGVPSEVALDWEGEPVDFRILAVSSTEGDFAVVDLFELVMREYKFGVHHPIGGAVKVAAFTSGDDVLFWPSGESPIYVVRDADLSAAPLAVAPSRHIPWDRNEGKDALGDRSGEKVWLVQRTESDTTLVDLVRVGDNTVVSTVELDGSFWIAGLVEDDLYLAPGGEDRDDLAVSEDGLVRQVASCRDLSLEYGDLRTVGVFGSDFVCLTLDDQRGLVFYNEANGRVDVVTAVEPDRWSPVVLPDIPAVNTRGDHSDRVLLSLRTPTAPMPKAVYAANLADHTVRLVFEYDELSHGAPLGVVDGRLIAMERAEGRESIVVTDIESGQRWTVVDLPDGYFVYDAK